MAYDFQAALDQAKAALNKNSDSNNQTSYKFPLVYPQKGTSLTVRLLFNPKSGLVSRLVHRHEKTACYRTYGTECPICKVMEDVKNATGQDPFGKKKASKSRGISYAQFISCKDANGNDFQLSKGKPEDKQFIQSGDTILLMYPWSVYDQINQIIAGCGQTPTGMEQAFCHADTGLFVNITTSEDYKYTTNAVPFFTFNPNNFTNEQFLASLDNLDDLKEQVLPSQINDDVAKQVQEYADEIYKQYITPMTPTANPPQVQPVAGGVPQPQISVPNIGNAFQQQVPQTNNVVPPLNNPTTTVPAINNQVPYQTTSVNTPAPQGAVNSKPQCFGNHQANDPKCIICPYEIVCSQPSDRDLPF